MNTLNDIMSQTADLELALEESGGELTPELEETFDKLSQDMLRKVDSYGFLLRKMKANIDATKALVQQLQQTVKAKENNLKHLKEHLVYNMKMYGKDKLAGETCTLSLRNTTSVETDDMVLLSKYQDAIATAQQALPAWIKLKAEVSKTELKNTFKEGEELPEGMTYKSNTSVNVR